MDKIKKYIGRFFSRTERNCNYDMTCKEIVTFSDEMEDTPNIYESVITLFEFGYVKGYRAALAEMKKKGGAG